MLGKSLWKDLAHDAKRLGIIQIFLKNKHPCLLSNTKKSKKKKKKKKKKETIIGIPYILLSVFIDIFITVFCQIINLINLWLILFIHRLNYYVVDYFMSIYHSLS